MKTTWTTNWKLIPIIAALILAAVVLAPAATAAGPRMTVNVPEPFLLDGDLKPAGSLTLRPVGDFTPASTLCEVCVGDECLGILKADLIGRGEADGRAVVVFERDSDGRLVLVGFSYPSHGAHGAYRFQTALL